MALAAPTVQKEEHDPPHSPLLYTVKVGRHQCLGHAGFFGAYAIYCPDIDTTFRIAVADGRLVLSSLRDAPAVLFPSDADSFETHDARYPALRLSFHRDRAGQVDGFSLATGRMRGLQFSREPK